MNDCNRRVHFGQLEDQKVQFTKLISCFTRIFRMDPVQFANQKGPNKKNNLMTLLVFTKLLVKMI